MEKIKTIVTALSAAINSALSGKEKAELILNYMIERIAAILRIKPYHFFMDRTEQLIRETLEKY